MLALMCSVTLTHYIVEDGVRVVCVYVVRVCRCHEGALYTGVIL